VTHINAADTFSGPDPEAQRVLNGRDIRLLVCDVDGTLVDSEDRISPRVAARMEEAVERGVTICLASGRPHRAMLPVLKQVPLTTPVISSGGANLYDPVTEQFLMHHTLPSRAVDCILAAGRDAGVSLLFEFPHAMKLEGDPAEAAKLSERIDFEVQVVPDMEPVITEMPTKIVLIGGDAALLHLELELTSSCPNVYIARSMADFLDFTAAGVNKGSALKALSAHLGIPLTQTAAIGDSPNDQSMLQLANLNACVQNAHPALHRNADLITPSNEESGVAWLLEQVFHHQNGRHPHI